jgi:hypothetical protein
MPDHHFKFTDLLYSSLCADGTVLPPVIITNDPSVPDDIEGDFEAFLVYMPDLTKPSANTTPAYLDKVKESYNGGDQLICDRGSEFKNKKVDEELEAMRVFRHLLPTAGGAFANPNDNAYFSQVEGAYKRMTKSTHAEAIKCLIKAYYLPTEDNIINYWKKCGITGRRPSTAAVDALISSHWQYDKKRSELYESYVAEEKHFRKNDRRLSADVRRRSPPRSLSASTLDGAHWTAYNHE